MPRLPYAAKQFLAEAEKIKPSTKYEADDEDGLRVYRTLRFDKRTTKWLGEALLFIDDERILDWHVTDAGYLHVTFAPGPEADTRDPFLLDDAVTVASSDSEQK
jgi:hypothetical protein